jgi:all-trans-retinol dehydrogenase (NAD+)
VTIASVASIIRGNKVASYVASKAAIYAFFNSVRLELLDLRPNITMSLVCPYAIDTGMF